MTTSSPTGRRRRRESASLPLFIRAWPPRHPHSEAEPEPALIQEQMPQTPTPTLDREHLRPGDRVCAAVSGGADSVAMLLLLHEANGLSRNALGIGLSAVHVH